jgi:hypothetical protein
MESVAVLCPIGVVSSVIVFLIHDLARGSRFSRRTGFDLIVASMPVTASALPSGRPRGRSRFGVVPARSR